MCLLVGDLERVSADGDPAAAVPLMALGPLGLEDGLPVLLQDADGLVQPLVEDALVGEQLLKLGGIHALEEHARDLAGRDVLGPGDSHLRVVGVGRKLLHVGELGLDLGEEEGPEVLLVLRGEDGLGLLLLGRVGLLGKGLLLHRVEEVGELHDLCRRLRAERDLPVGDDLAAGHGHGCRHGCRHGRGLVPLLRTPLGP